MAENTTTTGAAGAEGEEGTEGRFGRAKEFVGEKYQEASGKVRDGYNSMREKVDDVDFIVVLYVMGKGRRGRFVPSVGAHDLCGVGAR